jgi:dTDP-4-dehydrorhamnose reductase
VRWLVTGAAGMLGTDVVDILTTAGHEVRAVDLPELDITDPVAVAAQVRDVDVVLNCAAYTAVDAAETNEGLAFAINAVGPQLLARAAGVAGARIVQISTDYVFDGGASEPYPADAPIAPRSAYGRTKAAGEWAVRAETGDHLVLRTAWLYGAHGGNFPKTIAKLAAERDSLTVVDDQVGQPTWTRDVADLALRLVDAGAPAGTYHATSGGRCSWFDFARAVVAAAGIDPEKVTPTTSDAFVRPAPRPAWSVLAHDQLEAVGVTPIGPWDERWATAGAPVLGL